MARSGQVTVAAAGTAERGPDEPCHLVMLAAHPLNTGAAWAGEASGDIDSNSGYPLLAAGPGVVLEVANLRDLFFDVTTNDDKVCWLKLD